MTELHGHCTCGHVRYRLTDRPLFVHCCHCTWCRRESGAAFAVNAMIESDRLEVLSGAVKRVAIPSASGKGQTVARCPRCDVALWSHYAGAGEAVAFVRVGTLSDPPECPPDIHIFTSTKLPWVTLSDRKPVMAEYYRRSEHWPTESLTRWAQMKARG